MPPSPSRKAAASGASRDGILHAFDRLVAHGRDRVLIQSPSWAVTAGALDDWAARICDEIVRRAAAVGSPGASGKISIGPGSLVGLAAPNGAPFLAAFVALRRIGCTVLLLDHLGPAPERTRILAAMGADALVICPAGPRGAPGSVTLAAGPPCPEPRRLDAAHAVVKLTSGSTGAPRGVVVRAEALLADEAALASTMGLEEADRILAAIPMSHSYGFTTLALSALVRGLRLVSADGDGLLAPLDAADSCEATVMPTVPAYIRACLALAQPRPWPESLRLTITAGAPLMPATAERFREQTGRSIHVFYGASECGGICFDQSGEAGERGTVGTPVAGVALRLAPAATGHKGLLEVRSPAVAETYIPDPDPRLAGGRFITADLAMWRNGEVQLDRRADGAIVVRGFKVDPLEVERVIAAMPEVDDVAVVAVSASGGGGSIVRAVVACRSKRIRARDVMTWCRARLADYKVPRSIAFVEVLPVTVRGKLDRVALAHVQACQDPTDA